MKKCPYCAEDIQDEAVVCRHCGRDFKTGASQVQLVQPKKGIGCFGMFILGAVITVVGVLVLMAIWMAIGSRNTPAPDAASSASPSTPTSKVASMMMAITDTQRADLLKTDVKSARYPCKSVTKVYHAGVSPPGDDYWEISCAGGRDYAIQVVNDAKGSTSILDCKDLDALRRLSGNLQLQCFQPLTWGKK